MINWIKKLLGLSAEAETPEPMDLLRKTGSFRPLEPTVTAPPKAEKPASESLEIATHVEGQIEDGGPGKNVLVRKRFVREDTGTHETLTILDDSLVETDEADGIDPYNTGQFDRSRNWDSRFRK
ncbi:MAG: hypothetical protein AAF660_05040 [Pseudomonadota bacterium]